MPLSILLTVCLASPQHDAPHCDIRTVYEVETAASEEECDALTKQKANRILENALKDNPGSKGFSLGKCFDQSEYAQRVIAVNEYMAEHGYTSDFTAY